MTWLQNINPTPAFPAYTGPHKVGSMDVEIPASELDSPSEDAPADIPTVAFRVFYPCKPDSEQKAVRWIPSPQREYMAAYARFLGANSAFASIFSLFPQLLQLTSIPVHSNASLLEPNTPTNRWPVLIFSHGLGGSRNAYSHICGSLASHGIVVVAPDHRDGSAPISIIHDANSKKTTSVPYKRIDHKPSTDVYAARDAQLRIRLWELGMIHSALLKIDTHKPIHNITPDARKKGTDELTQFSTRLDVHEPGKISFAGHSFGAASVLQFVKSVFYSQTTPSPLLSPHPSSPLTRQITPTTPLILLDLWTLPLQSPSTAPLRTHPLPCFTPHPPPTPAPATPTTLAILSQAFHDWSSNRTETLRALAPPPSPSPPSNKALIFYPTASAHLSQSDFGILFPWATAKAFGAREPDRVLRLNVRAVLQMLRGAGVVVAPTSEADLEGLGGEATKGGDCILEQPDRVRGWVRVEQGGAGAGAGEGGERVGGMDGGGVAS